MTCFDINPALLRLQLPDVQLGEGGNPKPIQVATEANVHHILKELGIGLRFNMMQSAAVFEHPEFVDKFYGQTHAMRVLLDTCTRVGIRAHNDVRDIVASLAMKDRYHPMEEWLKSLKWDGKDHLQDLIDSIETDNSLWPTYCENFLVQVVEGVCGWRRERKQSLPYVLTLVGGQGKGKSYWLKSLGGPWIKGEAELHLATASGKDHQIEVLKHPVAELAELDGIFRKADVAHLKSFISREYDAIRAPYERAALPRPRMTTFCASVNETEFLNDPSGSRRFWPILVKNIRRDVEVDFEQLWAQAYALWLEDPNFELGEEDEQQRIKAALEHTLVSTEEETIREFYRRHHGHPRYPDVAMNRTEILTMLYGKHRGFSPVIISGVGKVLTDIIGPHRTLDKKQRSWWFPYNEHAVDVRTWPDKNHLEIVK